ncbi:MAG TPA: hypothetical protein VNW94_14150, partial [Streptosporangiaceae bacterium]|nr:hypothetical protein [Streptosporangiaceae bacterium]
PEGEASFFTRPAFFPASEGDGEQPKPVEEPRYSPPGESRYPSPQEPSFSPAESRYPAPGEPRRSFSGESRYSGPKETPYAAPAESRYPAPEEPRRSFSGESRYSGPKETKYTPLDDPRFSATGDGDPRRSSAAEPRYSGPKETPYSAPAETPYAAPAESRYPAPGEPRRSFSGESRYSGPTETPHSAPNGARFSPLGESRYSGSKERRISRPEGSAIPDAPSQNGTATAAEPADAETPEPAVTIEVPGKLPAQHPVRTTGELSVLRSPERPVGAESRLPDLWGYDGYPVVDNTPPVDDQAGIVSLGYIGAAIRRKKKVWVLTTALGVLVAGALYATHKATYTNTTTVQLALNPNLDAATALQTDAILAEDSTMAQLAMQKLGLHETVPAFLKTYTVTVSTTAANLLTFTTTAATPNAAYNETNTVATTFLQYRAQTELEKESANTAAQDQQVTQTQQQVSQLNSQIKKLKNEGVTTGDSRLARLQNDLTTAQTLLASMQANVASANATQRSTTAQLIAGSSVLDTGIPAEGVSKKKFAIEYGGGAIFGGLVIGLLIVAIGAILSDRLRRRDDVAAALGAPVRVSVASGGKRSRKANREADLKRVAAHLGAAVPTGSESAGSLVVVAVDGKKFVSEAIRELAVATAKEGKRVVVADLAGGALGQSFGTKEPGIRGVDVAGTRMVLVTPDRGDLAPVGPLHAPLLGTPMNGIQNVQAAADLFITLAAVNPATGAAHLKTWADEAVAVVTAGESSVTRVQAVGEMIRFAGADLTSAVLLGADGKDESLGYATV